MKPSTDDTVAVLQAIADLSTDGPDPVTPGAIARELGWGTVMGGSGRRRLDMALAHLATRGYVHRDGQGRVSLSWDYRQAEGAIAAWARRALPKGRS